MSSDDAVVPPDISPESPEARQKRAAHARKMGRHFERVKPGTRPFEVMKRVALGVYNDGFIHAGNLAYLALLTLFPFVIVAAAAARLFGQTEGGVQAVNALLQTMPPDVGDVLRKPIQDVLQARSGGLLWLGALVGLWTTGSFIETIRDILRRAYGVMMLIAFSASVFLSGAEQFIQHLIPQASAVLGLLSLLRVIPALLLFASLYFLFVSLTPRKYRRRQCRKWPGAMFVTVWWLATTALLPFVLSKLGGYDLTYGSLAGVIIALFFFFVIGLGVVIGAELNAALAETPDPSQEQISQASAEGEKA
jgi:membrane protein